MTKTALAHKEIEAKERIASKDRSSKEKIAEQDRASREKIARKDRWASIGSSIIGGAGRIGSALVKNDPEWYKRYLPDLSRFVNIPNFERIGSTKYGGHYKLGRPRGGVMVFEYINTVGPQTTGVTSRNPINQILMRSKEMVLRLNSRSNVNWEAGDLGYNIMVSGSIITQLGEIKRALEIYAKYSVENAYLAEELINALGFDFNDIKANYAEYKKQYVITAKRINSSVVAPRALSYYDRKWFLASNVFSDHDIKSGSKQLYAYATRNAFKLNSTGTIVLSETYSLISVTWTLMSYRFTQLDAAIQSITENPDFIEMYSDLRAAFGSNLFLVPESIDDSFSFNDNELNRIQIHNVKTLPVLADATAHTALTEFLPKNGSTSGGVYTPGTADIQQDSSGYLFQGSASGTIFYYNLGDSGYVSSSVFTNDGSILDAGVKALIGSGTLFDSPNDEITGDEILDMTRGAVCYTVEPLGGLHVNVSSCGTEVIVCGVIHALSNTFTPITFKFGTITAEIQASLSAAYAYFFGLALDDILTYLSDFDWSPMVTAAAIGGVVTPTGLPFSVYHAEMYHAFDIDADSLHDIHEACVLSEFYLNDASFSGSGR